MKKHVFYPIGFLLIVAGAMLGENVKILPCFACIFAGVVVILVGEYLKSKNANQTS